MKEQYSIKDFITKPIVMKITSEEEILRDKLMNEIISKHKPINISDRDDMEIIISMKNKNILSLNDNNEIVSIYPVSALPTNKKVTFKNGDYAYAMCAIDAIGFYYAFNQPIVIEGECEHCGDKIVLEVSDGKINIINGGDSIHILHTDLENMNNWSCCCCNIMHFFSCEESLEKWTKKCILNNKIFAVDLETANKIAWLLFSK